MKYMAYDFQKGVLRDSGQVVAIFGETKFPSSKLVERAAERLAAANTDPLDYSRLARASLAMQSFFLIFIAATGMNLSQAAELAWSQELDDAARDPSVERQGFRTVKYRANNRLVSFELGIQHLPCLRRYLELRAYYLNGCESQFLFIFYTSGNGDSGKARAGRGKDQVQALFRTLRRLCPGLPRVLPMQWRAAKQDFAIRHYDPATAAAAMQHSQSTALRHYSNGTDAAQRKELGDYLTNVERVLILQQRTEDSTESRPMGKCTRPFTPAPTSSSPPVTPDCVKPEGCLFCDKYRIHVDGQDLRKLLSARLVLRRVGSTAESFEQFQELFGGVLKRIEDILAGVGLHNSALVESVAYQVDFEGDLDHYWAAKLELLSELDF